MFCKNAERSWRPDSAFAASRVRNLDKLNTEDTIKYPETVLQS